MVFSNELLMKKLKLSLQNIEGAEVLSREQLKKVMGGEGGSGDDGGWPTCHTDMDCGTKQARCVESGNIVTSNGRCYSTTGSWFDKRCHYGFPCQTW